jgi:hypothetical protein
MTTTEVGARDRRRLPWRAIDELVAQPRLQCELRAESYIT